MALLNAIAGSACNALTTSKPSLCSFTRTRTPAATLHSRVYFPRRRFYLTKILAISTNDIKVGTNIEVDGAPWRVLEFLHVKPGKGAAFVRTKLRNYVTGNTVEKTFRAGAPIDEANIMKETKQFTYKDGLLFVFMDMTTYEESQLNESDLGDKTKWLKEGMECSVLSWNGQVVDVELPINVKYKVTRGEAGVRGDSARAGTRPVTIETGATVNVPLFIDVGEEVVVDTRSGTYVTRG